MEHLLRVAATNLQAVCFAKRRVIEPLSGDTHIFERKVHGVQNAVGADLKHDFGQSLRPEISTRRDVEILAQIVANGMLRLWTICQRPRYTIVNAPNVARQSFSKMAKDHPQLRIIVEQPTAHQAQGMN
jgi:hypothetical protein